MTHPRQYTHPPRPGQRALVVLGPHESKLWCTVLGEPRAHRVDLPQRRCRTPGEWTPERCTQYLIRVHVDGEGEPRDVAVERLVAWRQMSDDEHFSGASNANGAEHSNVRGAM